MSFNEILIGADALSTGQLLADKIAGLLLATPAGKTLHIALSGGQSPAPCFQALAMRPELNWEQVCFWWSDERCVPPDHGDSNYGLAKRLLLRPLRVAKDQIERLRGEQDPEQEARRYDQALRDRVTLSNGVPQLDLVLLGLGTDGHTASLFPGDRESLNTQELCRAVQHPDGSQRLTLTPRLINRARCVAFLVTGSSKRQILKQLVSGSQSQIPAQQIRPQGELWLVADRAAWGE
ncbi:MAG: 6-phosphogluconolactonase [Candidatus Sericytochromatia bacterium]